MNDDYAQRSADEQEQARLARLRKDAEHAAVLWIEQQTPEALMRILESGNTNWPCFGQEPICIGQLIHEYLEFLDQCAREKLREDIESAKRRAKCPMWGSW